LLVLDKFTMNLGIVMVVAEGLRFIATWCKKRRPFRPRL
jgi:hypothetical protein